MLAAAGSGGQKVRDVSLAKGGSVIRDSVQRDGRIGNDLVARGVVGVGVVELPAEVPGRDDRVLLVVDLELAVATSGVSLCPAMMQAIVAVMVVDTGSREVYP